ncbi:minor capsid protein [Alkalibaculum sp. M08DMB]|uniref:Minor capsid protein n=1 Tax=Alkalibaculum sporogenes TaxID=2655001 RepID=A0A6A7K9U7_9FIRM|nr:minor capsid protein [Alkalibaculum sporogenes]MPW26258.1 minor capsid protein [Alkalibaculum sporogenes]
MGVTVTFNKQAVKARISTATEKGTYILANELLKDSNYYAREDSGELIRSSIRASNIKKGTLIWDTPYAKKMYYVGSPSRDKNPNASTLWAQKAADENKEKYLRIVQKVMDNEV